MKAIAYVSPSKLSNHINKFLFSVTAILFLCVPSFAQTQQKNESSKQKDDGVVRITTTLVQVDVLVTDKNGLQVTDLKAEDFEIFEDGRSQNITNFSYVLLQPSSLRAPDRVVKKGEPAAPEFPAALRPEQVRRTIAIVVDDLGLSFESVHFAREALKKFVNTQLQPGDLAAVIPTSGGIGALEQFTSDKRQLFAAIERVHWQLGRTSVASFEPVSSESNRLSSGRKGEEDELESDLDNFREQLFSVGTLGAIHHIVRGLNRLPGRKAVVVISDGFPITERNGNINFKVKEALQRLTEFINRSSVVAYTIDARGVSTLGITAADNFSQPLNSSIGGLNTNGGGAGGGRLQERIISTLDQRRDFNLRSQDGLKLLAQGSGGFYTNSNDMNIGLKKVMEDQSGYYLIGYDPDESTFSSEGRKKTHKLTVKVKRSGLSVRTRTGFYGIEEEVARPANRTRSEQMIEALTSPFASDGVGLSITPLFNHEDKKGSFLRSLIHIDSKGLSFEEEADGWRKSVFDVLAVSYGENFSIVDQTGKSFTVRAKGETFERIKKDGLLYILDVPVKKAGAYQLRVAVRDTSSERVGSANQFVEVPDIKKGRIALSGVVLSGEQTIAQQGAETDAAAPSNLVTAMRKFKRGATFRYDYYIYNAKKDEKTSLPQVKTQIRLYRNGQMAYEGKEQPFESAGKDSPQKLTAGGRLQLGAQMEPGQYILQVIVTDELAKEKRRVSAQWIDFEIVE